MMAFLLIFMVFYLRSAAAPLRKPGHERRAGGGREAALPRSPPSSAGRAPKGSDKPRFLKLVVGGFLV